MGLNYNDLYERNGDKLNSSGSYLKKHLYREDTHVFGYYILTAIFLNDYKQFIQWCDGNNIESFMKFNCTEQSFKNIGEYITTMYSNKDLLKTMDSLKTTYKTTYNAANTTTRMSIIDIII
jgi:hypothetical protein